MRFWKRDCLNMIPEQRTRLLLYEVNESGHLCTSATYVECYLSYEELHKAFFPEIIIEETYKKLERMVGAELIWPGDVLVEWVIQTYQRTDTTTQEQNPDGDLPTIYLQKKPSEGPSTLVER